MSVTDWTPTTRDVGVQLRVRTKDDHGNYLGDFTEDTRPTGDDVARIIELVVPDIESVIGDVSKEYYQRAIAVTALAVAMQIEVTYFPEQLNTGRSPYPQLREMFTERLQRLATNVSDDPNESTGAGAPSLLPFGSFESQFPPVPGTEVPSYWLPWHRRRVTWDTNW